MQLWIYEDHATFICFCYFSSSQDRSVEEVWIWFVWPYSVSTQCWDVPRSAEWGTRVLRGAGAHVSGRRYHRRVEWPVVKQHTGHWSLRLWDISICFHLTSLKQSHESFIKGSVSCFIRHNDRCNYKHKCNLSLRSTLRAFPSADSVIMCLHPLRWQRIAQANSTDTDRKLCIISPFTFVYSKFYSAVLFRMKA